MRNTTNVDLRQMSAEVRAPKEPVASGAGDSSSLGLSAIDSGEGSSWQLVVGIGKCFASCRAAISQCLFTNAGMSAKADWRCSLIRALHLSAVRYEGIRKIIIPVHDDATEGPPVVSSQALRISGLAADEWSIEVLYVFCNGRIKCFKFFG